MPVSLTRRGWGFVLGAVAFGAAGFFAQLRDFWYFPIFFAAVPVVALVVVLVLRWAARLEVRLLAADPTPSVGSTVALAAVLSHRLPFALTARVNWELGEATASADVCVPRGASQRISQQWSAGRRGPASVGIPSVWIIDPLGVAAARQQCDGRATLKGALVLPRLLDAVPELHDSASHRDAAVHATAHRDHGADEPVGALRAYQPGDPRRTVDWKQSARKQELLVRVAEAANARVRQLTIDTDPGLYSSAEEFEIAVSRAATAGVAWLRGGDIVLLAVDGEAPVECVSDGELLRRLAHVTLGLGAHATH